MCGGCPVTHSGAPARPLSPPHFALGGAGPRPPRRTRGPGRPLARARTGARKRMQGRVQARYLSDAVRLWTRAGDGPAGGFGRTCRGGRAAWRARPLSPRIQTRKASPSLRPRRPAAHGTRIVNVCCFNPDQAALPAHDPSPMCHNRKNNWKNNSV
jgi:hypothetical protein